MTQVDGKPVSQDLRDVANYPLSEAARFLRLSAQTLRDWSSPPEDGRRALIELAETSPPTLSFWNLFEAFHIRACRAHGVSLGAIRDAVDQIRHADGIARPLLTSRLLTDRKALLRITRDGDSLECVSDGGQLAIRPFLERHLHRVEWDQKHLPVGFSPWSESPDESPVLLIDHRYSFGRLVLASSKIPAAVIHGQVEAGDSVEEVAQDFGIDSTEVEAAVAWFRPAAEAA